MRGCPATSTRSTSRVACVPRLSGRCRGRRATNLAQQALAGADERQRHSRSARREPVGDRRTGAVGAATVGQARLDPSAGLGTRGCRSRRTKRCNVARRKRHGCRRKRRASGHCSNSSRRIAHHALSGADQSDEGAGSDQLGGGDVRATAEAAGVRPCLERFREQRRSDGGLRCPGRHHCHAQERRSRSARSRSRNSVRTDLQMRQLEEQTACTASSSKRK